jgi:hypothetical protein
MTARGTRAPMPASPDFVECVVCRRRRRIARAVSECVECRAAVCPKHLDDCCAWQRAQAGQP